MSLAELFYDGPRFSGPALCAEVGGDLWFPEGQGSSAAEAKKVCRMCPVRAECLEWALEHDEAFGVWGGLSERERRRLKGRVDCPPAEDETTWRRGQVARYTALGWSSGAIAQLLGVPVWTVQRDRKGAA